MTHLFCWVRKLRFLENFEFVFRFGSSRNMGRLCGHDTHDLICCRRLFEILIVATKSSGGANIASAARAIDFNEMNKTRRIIQWCIGITNVRSIAAESLMWPWAELKIQSKWALAVMEKLSFVRKLRFSKYYDFIFRFWWKHSNKNSMRRWHFES